ncbi:MAG: hypothetical protein K2K72_04930, partial [Duncaniella sp.]|nr:hypothetical protein [Duncaniella sp.]
LSTFITDSPDGVDIHKICRSAGLGPSSNRSRDGSANYYLDGSDVTVVSNEGKGIGSFIMASLEHERRATSGMPVLIADSASEVMIYDLRGNRLASPPEGLYIEVSDGKATKKINRR